MMLAVTARVCVVKCGHPVSPHVHERRQALLVQRRIRDAVIETRVE